MYDIQRQKPALRLDAGVFNDDFDNYAIHIGRKSTNDRTIEDVIMYDHSEASRGMLTEITAESGEMFASEDGRYFVMHLRNGHQYIETSPTSVRGSGSHFPFVRTNYKTWTKIFDLSEFQLARTNEELFKQNRNMLSSSQLLVAIDSIELKILQRQKSLSNQVASYFSFMENDSTFLTVAVEEFDSIKAREDSLMALADSLDAAIDTAALDTISEEEASVDVETDPVIQKKKLIKPLAQENKTAEVETDPILLNRAKEIDPRTRVINKTKRTGLSQKVVKLFEEIDTTADFQKIIDMVGTRERAEFYSKARSAARGIQSQAESAIRTLDGMRESKVKHIYELHTKYSMAVVCMIFIFIGAPMGAIVRKGGFGYPILVSIIFFMLFVILTIFCRKIAETFVLPAALAGWVPCAILFPVGLILTRKAMNDSKLVNLDRYTAFFRKIFRRTNLKSIPLQ
jgi:lipopolysaccharide export system permease protein